CLAVSPPDSSLSSAQTLWIARSKRWTRRKRPSACPFSPLFPRPRKKPNRLVRNEKADLSLVIGWWPKLPRDLRRKRFATCVRRYHSLDRKPSARFPSLPAQYRMKVKVLPAPTTPSPSLNRAFVFFSSTAISAVQACIRFFG